MVMSGLHCKDTLHQDKLDMEFIFKCSVKKLATPQVWFSWSDNAYNRFDMGNMENLRM